MNETAKNLLLWLIIAVVLLTVFQSFSPHDGGAQQMAYSDFVQQVQNDNVSSVKLGSTMPSAITGKLKDGSALRTVAPFADDTLVPNLLKHKVEVRQEPSDNGFSLLVI